MESRMNDDRIEQAESQTLEIAHEGDKHAKDAEADGDATDDDEPRVAPAPIASNVIRTTSPYAPEDIHEGQTFEQRDPATIRAREEAERLIH